MGKKKYEKPIIEAVESVAVENTIADDKPQKISTRSVTKSPESESVFVYIGPSVRGLIQNGTIYRGTRSDVIKSVSAAVERYPTITKMIVPSTELTAAKEQIKKGGNALSCAYKALIKEIDRRN